jgi:hypothetical protein
MSAGDRHPLSYWWYGRGCRVPADAIRRRQMHANF